MCPRIFFLSFFMILALSACTLTPHSSRVREKHKKAPIELSGARPFNAAPAETYHTTNYRVQTDYEPSQQKVARVGDIMFRARGVDRRIYRRNQVTPPRDIKMTGGATTFHLKKGRPYPVIGTMKLESHYYDVVKISDHDGVLIDDKGRIARRVAYIKGPDMHLLSAFFDIRPKGARLSYEGNERVEEVPRFDYGLRFDGADKDRFFVTYLEYLAGQGTDSGYFEKMSFKRGTPVIEVQDVAVRIIDVSPNRIDYVVLNEP